MTDLPAPTKAKGDEMSELILRRYWAVDSFDEEHNEVTDQRLFETERAARGFIESLGRLCYDLSDPVALAAWQRKRLDNS